MERGTSKIFRLLRLYLSSYLKKLSCPTQILTYRSILFEYRITEETNANTLVSPGSAGTS